jgi:Peptidase U49
MKPVVAAIAVMLLVQSTAGASSIAYMYTARTLERERPRFEQRIGELYRIISSLLGPQEQRAFADVKIEFPLIGTSTGTPLEFYTAGEVARASVFMPVFSLLFLEDLATAYAWLHVHGYSFETVEEYLTMLKYKRASDFPGDLYPPPLKALQIPQEAMSEESVKTLALSLRNEAYAFVLLHELGHVRYRHPGYRSGVPLEQVRKNEAEADRFALLVLERADTIPMGMALWFMAQVNYMPSTGQLMAEGTVKSAADWRAYLETSATHPLTVERLSAIALYLNRRCIDHLVVPLDVFDALGAMPAKLIAVGIRPIVPEWDLYESSNMLGIPINRIQVERLNEMALFRDRIRLCGE